MKQRYFFLIFSIWLLNGITHAQELSINEYLKSKEVEPKKVNFIFQLDNRNSFVFDKRVKFSGLRIGLEYKQVHDMGLGIYSTMNPVQVKYKKNINNENADIKAEFSYTTFFYQFAFYHNEKWEIAIPVHIGSGTANVRVVDRYTDSLIFRKDGLPELDEKELPFSISEIGIGGQYKIKNWLGIGAGVGYRFLLVGDDRQRHLFDGVTYALKLKLFFGEIIKSINKTMSYEQYYIRKNK